MSDIKERLLANRVNAKTDKVEIPDVGVIVVRGLSRWEMMEGDKLADKPLAQERWILSCAMVEPAMAEHEVAEWQKASPAAEINAVASKINELSGIGKAAAKSDVGEVRD